LPNWDRAISDLGSRYPEVRSYGARLIREQHLYQRTPRDKWDALEHGLKEGMTADELLQNLHKAGIAMALSDAYVFPSAVYRFPLDDCWKLVCAINQSTLTEFEVTEEPKEIFVSPPTGYTGNWQLYRIDGEPSRKRHYENGHETTLMVRS
jgi:hypothetical protein